MRKHVVPALQKIVDDESAMNQVAFGLEIEDRFDHPSKLNWNAVNKINTDRVDMSYPPILQSGGVYNLKPNAETQDAGLHYGTESSPGVILVSFGARYKGYNANLARTYLVRTKSLLPSSCLLKPPPDRLLLSRPAHRSTRVQSRKRRTGFWSRCKLISCSFSSRTRALVTSWSTPRSI